MRLPKRLEVPPDVADLVTTLLALATAALLLGGIALGKLP
jgi:hypothetical protein